MSKLLISLMVCLLVAALTGFAMAAPVALSDSHLATVMAGENDTNSGNLADASGTDSHATITNATVVDNSDSSAAKGLVGNVTVNVTVDTTTNTDDHSITDDHDITDSVVMNGGQDNVQAICIANVGDGDAYLGSNIFVASASNTGAGPTANQESDLGGVNFGQVVANDSSLTAAVAAGPVAVFSADVSGNFIGAVSGGAINISLNN